MYVQDPEEINCEIRKLVIKNIENVTAQLHENFTK
jgi:hypothetical protein